jgi:hypothetical protein
MIGSRALLAAVVGAIGLPVGGGCIDSAKSDGQIQSAPEAAKAAQEAAKSISENMIKKYADKMKKRR